MLSVIAKAFVLSGLLLGGTIFLSAQTELGSASSSGRGDPKEEQPHTFKEMLSKQRVEREKKDYEELLKRGDEAAQLSAQLEDAFLKTSQLSKDDEQKLASLEKLVLKIRNELGGGDDDEDDDVVVAKERRPGTLRQAFDNLKETTLMLADELRKSSRFTISAAAIRSSNTVLNLVRFLRLKK